MVADDQISSEIGSTYRMHIPIVDLEKLRKGLCNKGAIGIIRPESVFVAGMVLAPAVLKAQPTFRDLLDLP
jgi:hypothetical protein